MCLTYAAWAFLGIPHANILAYWHIGTSSCVLDCTIRHFAFHDDRIGFIYAHWSVLNRLADHSVVIQGSAAARVQTVPECPTLDLPSDASTPRPLIAWRDLVGQGDVLHSLLWFPIVFAHSCYLLLFACLKPYLPEHFILTTPTRISSLPPDSSSLALTQLHVIAEWRQLVQVNR